MDEEFALDSGVDLLEEISENEMECTDNDFEDLTQESDMVNVEYSKDEIYDEFFAEDLIDESCEMEDSYDIDNMSLNELRELRDTLTDDKEVEDLEDVTAEQEPDYSYHWDGGATHNVEWDDETDVSPEIKERVLKR